MPTCRPVGPGRLCADCRNAAQSESLGHRPRNRFISNTNALKGQNWGRASSFRPVGAVCVSIHFSQGDALGFRILGLGPGTHSAPQCPELSRPLTATPIQLGCGRSPRQVNFGKCLSAKSSPPISSHSEETIVPIARRGCRRPVLRRGRRSGFSGVHRPVAESGQSPPDFAGT